MQDFGDSIPGHGGITDRMDCQVTLMKLVTLHKFMIRSFNSSIDFAKNNTEENAETVTISFIVFSVNLMNQGLADIENQERVRVLLYSSLTQPTHI